MIAIAIPMFCFIITLIVFAVENTTTKPWEYVVLHTLFRTEEAAMVFCMLQIVSRKPLFKPENVQTESSSGAKENGFEMSDSTESQIRLDSIQSNST